MAALAALRDKEKEASSLREEPAKERSNRNAANDHGYQRQVLPLAEAGVSCASMSSDKRCSLNGGQAKSLFGFDSWEETKATIGASFDLHPPGCLTTTQTLLLLNLRSAFLCWFGWRAIKSLCSKIRREKLPTLRA